MRVIGKLTFPLLITLIFGVICFAQYSGNYVIIRVEPQNVKVTIDSMDCHVEDGIVQHFLTLGKHTFAISAKNYESMAGDFNILSSQRTEINIKLTPTRPRLKIKSYDDGVLITVDKNIIEGKEWEGFINEGEHIIRATKKGYTPFEKKISVDTVNSGQIYTVEIPELKKIKGSINLNIQPIDAEVYLDEKYVGHTPMVINDIEVGRHKLKITKTGYVSYSKSIRVKDGQMTNLKGRLVAYESVDLGLSVKWATFNVGASHPDEEGIKVCWGSTSPSTEKSPLIGYNSIGTGLIHTNQLSSDYDAAHLLWGGSWRMPSSSEIYELMLKCKWEYYFINNTAVIKITGPNGNYIEMPVGTYWTNNRNSLWGDQRLGAYALSLSPNFSEAKINSFCGEYYGEIYYNATSKYYVRGGRNEDGGYGINGKRMIRPVCAK